MPPYAPCLPSSLSSRRQWFESECRVSVLLVWLPTWATSLPTVALRRTGSSHNARPCSKQKAAVSNLLHRPLAPRSHCRTPDGREQGCSHTALQVPLLLSPVCRNEHNPNADEARDDPTFWGARFGPLDAYIPWSQRSYLYNKEPIYKCP